MPPGTDGLFGAIVAIFETFAWLWIAFGVLALGIMILTAMRSRHSTWIRSPQEIRTLPRLASPVADRSEWVA